MLKRVRSPSWVAAVSVFFWAMLVPMVAWAVPPPNDLCAGAEVVPAAGPFPYDTAVTADITDATTTGDPPIPSCQANVSRSIWYAFTPTVTAAYTISNCSDTPTGSTVDDTVIAVYTSSDGTCAGTMTQVAGACDDDSCTAENFQSVLGVSLTAGTTYYIVSYQFDTPAPTAGNTAVQLRILQSAAAAPSNDQCGGAEVIPAAGPFPHLTTITADISNATSVGDPPAPSCQASVSRSIWQTFTPTVTANYTVQTCSTGPTATTVADTVVAIYTSSDGTCAGTMTQVAGACSDNACSNQSSVSTLLTAGTTYFFLIYKNGAAPPITGQTAVQVRVTAAFPPSNDTCATPTTLPLNTLVSGTLAAATNNFQLSTAAPNCYALPAGPPVPIGQTTSTAAGRDVVYSFTAPTAGSYSIRAQETVAGGNLVLGMGPTCPTAAGPTTLTDCSGAANRNSNTSAFSASEELMCVPMTAGQQVFVFVDETTAVTTGGGFVIEATPCVRETEANGTPATANALTCGTEGTISPTGDIDFFSLGTPAAGSRVFAMADGASGNSTDFDMRVTTATDTLEYDDANNSTPWGGLAPNIAGRALSGADSYVRMSHFSTSTAAEPYRIFSTVQPPGTGLGLSSATAETEPNNSLAAASSSGNLFFSGSISTGGATGDVDVFKFCAEAGDSIFLSIDGDPLRDLTPIEAALVLFDSAGTQIVGSGQNDFGSSSSNTSGAGSLTSSTPNSPGEAGLFRATYTGAYYAGIGTPGSGATATGDYLYSIALNCLNGAQLSSDLGITISDAPDPVTAGANVAYAVTMTNVGKTALDAQWTTTIPANMTFVSATGPAGWTCANNAGTVTCSTSCFPAGAPADFTLTLAASLCAPTGSVLSTTATASSKTPDPAAGNNSATTTTTVTGGCPDDGNACTAETCDVVTGCASSPVADGTMCSDGNSCTLSDACVAGACVAGMPVMCLALDACHVPGTCDPATGICSDPNAPDGTMCSDGNSCTLMDICAAGTCASGMPVVCTPLDACHVAGVCDPATGVCSDPNNEDGTACNDSNSCTQTDTCMAGTCTGGNNVVCPPPNACQAPGVCDVATGMCTFALMGPDTDADTVGDACDNCSTAPNTNQSNGDMDLLGDVCDNCPMVDNDGQEDLDKDGEGDDCDNDIDGDGISNSIETGLGLDPSDKDSDGDFIDDCTEACEENDGSCLENGVCTFGTAANTDGTGEIDALDDDSDGDGKTDAEEAGDMDLDTEPVDTDGDGVPDYRDVDGGMGGMGGMGGAGGMGGIGGSTTSSSTTTSAQGGAGGGAAGGDADPVVPSGGCDCGTATGESNSTSNMMLLLGIGAAVAGLRRRRNVTKPS